MNGGEFIEKLNIIKSVDDLTWVVSGENTLEPISVRIVAIVDDGEVIGLKFPLYRLDPKYNDRVDFFQNASVALLINKFMELLGEDLRVTAHDDLSVAINFIRLKIAKVNKI